MSSQVRIVLASLASLLACEAPTQPQLGGLSVRVLVASGSPTPLDAGRVLVRDGPTNKDTAVTPGTTVTIGGLLPGSYTVALEGFIAGEVDHFGQTKGVNVTAGQNTQASVMFNSFRPAPPTFPDTFSVGKQVDVPFSLDTNAISYHIEWSKDPGFGSGVGTSPATTSPAHITVADYDVYYIRVRAVDPYQSVGAPGLATRLRILNGGPATQLAFTVQPSTTNTGAPITPPVQVTAQDAFGSTVNTFTGNVTAAIGTNPGGGTLSGMATVAAVGGVAKFSNLSIDRVGNGYTLSAAATGLPSATSTAFNITTSTATRLEFAVQPVTTPAGATINPAVQVVAKDGSGNTVPAFTSNVTVVITTGTGPPGAALSGTTSRPAVGGVATFNDLSISLAGTGYQLTATSTGLTSDTSAAFNITAGSVSAAQSTVSAAPTTIPASSGASTSTITVTARDAFGNPISGDTVMLAATGAGNTTTQPTTTTNASGVTTGTLSSTGAGSKIVSATINGVTITQTDTVTVTAGPAVKLGFVVQPGTSQGAAPIAPVVQVAVQDAFGNTVSGAANAVTVTLGANPGGGTLSGTTMVGASGGIAMFSNLRIDRPGSGYTLVAMTGGLTGATSSPFDVRLTFDAVSAGHQHTCGLTIIGAVYCWGNNAFGSLGDGTTTDRTSPVLVTGSGSGALVFAAIAAGDFHTCGVTTTGAAYCWGYNSNGQLGDASMTSRTSPVPVSGGQTFATVNTVADADHTCGVATTGAMVPAAYCWGGNFNGQLGDGTTTDRSSPVRVLGLAFAVLNVSPGTGHSCGVWDPSYAYCWGYNGSGQLGDGTTTNQTTPVRVSGGLSFAKVTAAGVHTCGLTTSGEAYCWGDNTVGQLGDGTMTSQTTPVRVSGGLSFAVIGAAHVHTCGVTTTGVAYCWGRNDAGELGDSTTTTRTTPSRVSGGLSFAAISAGYVHTCGVTTTGVAYCWGLNSSGQLGDGTTTNRTSPVRVVQ